MVARIIPGTHKDAWVIPDLKTIALYYPGLKDADGGMFGTECFYFNYAKEIDNLKTKLQQKISSDYHIKTQAGKDLYSQYGGTIDVTTYAPTDKLVKISYAWIKFLRNNPTYKPPLSVQHVKNIELIKNQEYKSGKNRYVISKDSDDIKAMCVDAGAAASAAWNGNVTQEQIFPGYQFNMPYAATGVLGLPIKMSFNGEPGNAEASNALGFFNSERQGRSTDEFKKRLKSVEYNLLSPLAHFPPDVTPLLSEIIFFDPSNASKYVPRIVSQYGGVASTFILGKCQQLKRKIYYSEIVKSSSTGFNIDFSVFGLNIKFNVPFQNLTGDITTLDVWNSAGFYSYKKTGAENVVYIPKSIFSHAIPIPLFTSVIWDRRDQWIQYWTAGGKIPTSISEICYLYNNVPVAMRGNYRVNDAYPITIAHNDTDVLDQIIQVATVLASVVYSAATGNVGGIIQMFTDITKGILMQAFPGAAAYINMGTLMITTNLIYKNFGKPDRDNKVSEALLGVSGSMVSSSLQQYGGSVNTNGMIQVVSDAYDEDPDTFNVINAIAELKEERLRPKATPSVGGGGGTPKVEEKKSSGLLLAGAVVLGALAVKKLLKKGK